MIKLRSSRVLHYTLVLWRYNANISFQEHSFDDKGFKVFYPFQSRSKKVNEISSFRCHVMTGMYCEGNLCDSGARLLHLWLSWTNFMLSACQSAREELSSTEGLRAGHCLWEGAEQCVDYSILQLFMYFN